MQHDLQVLRRGGDEIHDVLVEGDDADAIALLLGEHGERGGEEPGVVELGEPLASEAHRAGDVEQEGEAGVGVGFELLHVEAVGAGEEPPVDAADVVSRHVGPVLGEVYGSSEVGRAMKAADEALDHRAGEEAQVRDPRENVRVDEAEQAFAAARGVRSIGASGHGGLLPTSSTSESKRSRGAGPRCARKTLFPTARGSW